MAIINNNNNSTNERIDIETYMTYRVWIENSKPSCHCHIMPYSRGSYNSIDFDLGSIKIENKLRHN